MNLNHLCSKLHVVLRRHTFCMQLHMRNSSGSVIGYVGSNKDLPVRIASKEDHPSVVNFLLQNFRVEEPTTRALNLGTNETLELFSIMADEALQDPVSFIVQNPKKEIVCCRLSSIIEPKKHKDIEMKSALSEKTLQLINFLDMFDKDMPLTMSGYDKLFKLMIVSVKANLFRQGIAKDLYPLSFRLAKEHGCQGICTTATSYRTQKLYENMGFRVIKTIMHADYKDSNGVRIIETDDETNCGKLMLLDIKE